MEWVSASRCESRRLAGSNRDVGTLYFFSFFFLDLHIFIYILAKFSLCVIFIRSGKLVYISEFDLLIRTYTKWLYKEQFRCY